MMLNTMMLNTMMLNKAVNIALENPIFSNEPVLLWWSGSATVNHYIIYFSKKGSTFLRKYILNVSKKGVIQRNHFSGRVT